MSEIRTYLEGKAQTPSEWLSREPRTTHPAILAAVRDCPNTNNDVTERHVESVAGDLPEHRYHGHAERDPLTRQLGHEVYVARGILHDEKAAALEQEAIGEGFVPLKDAELVDGARYEILLGIRYSGYDVADYSAARPVKAKKIPGGSFVFLPKGARTRYIVPSGPALIKAAAST